jgi:hypothetical protein
MDWPADFALADGAEEAFGEEVVRVVRVGKAEDGECFVDGAAEGVEHDRSDELLQEKGDGEVADSAFVNFVFEPLPDAVEEAGQALAEERLDGGGVRPRVTGEGAR